MPSSLLSIEQARAQILSAVRPLGVEDVPVGLALGRALSEDVVAAGDVPPFPNSAMDGFAVRAGARGRLRVAGESRAGHPAAVGPEPGEAIAVSTGAALPPGAQAVVPVEQVSLEDGCVVLDEPAAAGAHIRGAGDDIRAGTAVLAAGTLMGPAELGVAVAAGRGSLRCAVRPRVAIRCTGDELRRPGQALGPGEIHNSNAIVLEALARRAGGWPLDEGTAPVADDAQATREALAEPLAAADVLVVCGGVSVGAHDHVKGALRDLGVQERFWRVALRPGKPTWFGVREHRLVFGLPGNPVSAMVTFLLFVRPALAALQGLAPDRPRRLASLGQDVPRHPERDEAVRVALTDGPGGTVARPTGDQASHRLTSVLDADGLMIVRAGRGVLAQGSSVAVEPIA